MSRFHPKTWEDGVMPLDEFPEHKQREIAAAVARSTPPPRWLEFIGGSIESRAWYEWHWARGMKLRSKAGERVYRPKIPDALRQAVYDHDGRACLHCGATDRLSLDHIHPFSLGGEDTFENLQTLCRPCNSRKGARV